MKKRLAAGFVIVAAAAGCTTPTADAPAPAIAALVETQPTSQSDANAATLVLGQTGQAFIIGTAAAGGLEVYRLDGAKAGTIPAGAAVGIDARHGLPGTTGETELWTLASLDESANLLRFYSFDAATGAAQERTARPVDVGFAAESLCLYHDALDRNLYAFALGGGGEIAQYVVFATGGQLDARLVRQFHVASEASYCVADDVTGDLYVAEQAVGVWRFGASPEAETAPELIDAVRLGAITEEVGGLAIYDAGPANFLIVSNASANDFHVYDRNEDHRRVGSFAIGLGSGVDAVEAAGGLYATSAPVGDRFARGLLIATDDSDDKGMNYKLASWADIAEALELPAGEARDPRRVVPARLATVTASVETPPVETSGDAADDPAIWVHPTDPALSLVIGTQKQSGLYVYGLDGAVVQFLPDGRMNNVDVRDDFSLGGARVPLVTASNRSNDSISIYRIDPQTRQLVSVADGVQPTGFADPYGLCMYRSAATGRYFVFVNDTEGGMKQWELIDAGNGRVRTNLVREFAFSGQAEGCVADDETGVLYVAEEDVGLWRMRAEPDGGDTRTSIATVANQPAVKDDLEGVGLYAMEDGRGFLVLSSQGNNSYAVFRREGDNAYVGSFAVVADGARGIDGASETDGLDVTSASLPGAYGRGLLVVQDGRNVAPPERQNFKFVPWSAAADALGIE